MKQFFFGLAALAVILPAAAQPLDAPAETARIAVERSQCRQVYCSRDDRVLSVGLQCPLPGGDCRSSLS